MSQDTNHKCTITLPTHELFSPFITSACSSHLEQKEVIYAVLSHKSFLPFITDVCGNEPQGMWVKRFN